MGNTIFDAMNEMHPQQQNNQNGVFGMINAVRNSPNPNAAMQQLAANNPQVQGVMQYIQQNGGDARSAFYNKAAEMGVDPEPILRRLRQFG